MVQTSCLNLICGSRDRLRHLLLFAESLSGQGQRALSTIAPMFVHLRLHTEFSVVDGTTRVNAMIKAAAEDGQVAMAITDFNNLFGGIKFYKEGRAKGVKPILGAELVLEGSDGGPASRGSLLPGNMIVWDYQLNINNRFSISMIPV